MPMPPTSRPSARRWRSRRRSSRRRRSAPPSPASSGSAPSTRASISTPATSSSRCRRSIRSTSTFMVPQRDLPLLVVGRKITLTTDAYKGTGFDGKITAVSPSVDTSTRNVKVEAAVPNPKRLLLPGMYANVNISSGTRRALPHAAADRHRLQSVRRHRVRREAVRQEGRERQRPAHRAADLRDHGAQTGRPDRDPDGDRRGRASGDERRGQAQERTRRSSSTTRCSRRTARIRRRRNASERRGKAP